MTIKSPLVIRRLRRVPRPGWRLRLLFAICIQDFARSAAHVSRRPGPSARTQPAAGGAVGQNTPGWTGQKEIPTATQQSPTVRRRRLALELRRFRDAASLTCEEVAEHLECLTSKISRIETGRVSVSPRDVRDMLQLYGVPGPQQDSPVQLAPEWPQKGWWHAYSDAIEPHFATYIGLRRAASEIPTSEVTSIPCLLP